MAEILIVYYSRNGGVAQLARHVARGVEEVPDMRARLRNDAPGTVVKFTVKRGSETKDISVTLKDLI